LSKPFCFLPSGAWRQRRHITDSRRIEYVTLVFRLKIIITFRGAAWSSSARLIVANPAFYRLITG